MFNNIYDFFINFSKNLYILFEWIFFASIEFNLGGNSYTIVPIDLLIATGALALSVGLLRRIL